MCYCCPSPPPVQLMSIRPDDYHRFFRTVYGRRCNALNNRYLLPADEDELKRFDLLHRLTRFVLGGSNYIGPVKQVLSPERKPAGDKLRVLDLGTGGGLWAIDMADEFPHTEVTGVDLAPLQPEWVPVNCSFEVCDLDAHCLPYESNSFDVVHARNMHAGISNYPHFLHELSRILRPGGVLILIEFDLRPVADGILVSSQTKTDMYGWCALTEEIQRCLGARGVDIAVPEKMGVLAYETGCFPEVLQQHADIPIGFWPKDPTMLTVGQLAWMNFDLLVLAVKPLLLSSGLPESRVKMLMQDAQRDLYQPLAQMSTRLHFVHAVKRA
ncbi:S-adenosyl-L-methionine-dependent methyltransferase [Vararia minispora EC-137]|uniref:S-adenosyl-L-methionine-dependent methyltransferase n=1 Tax=Vararia minispora EC-137 TaxID=1314806 RepID=A0ACB8QWB2_9AGAM|nr:S-adenosyl-L-methionine-dependent methyltransferase [Vararia minispora EC-137]